MERRADEATGGLQRLWSPRIELGIVARTADGAGVAARFLREKLLLEIIPAVVEQVLLEQVAGL